MATGNFDDLSSAAQDVVRNLIARAEEKLYALNDRRGQLRRRIQALNYLAKTFERARQSPDPDRWLSTGEDGHDELRPSAAESAATPQ